MIIWRPGGDDTAHDITDSGPTWSAKCLRGWRSIWERLTERTLQNTQRLLRRFLPAILFRPWWTGSG